MSGPINLDRQVGRDCEDCGAPLFLDRGEAASRTDPGHPPRGSLKNFGRRGHPPAPAMNQTEEKAMSDPSTNDSTPHQDQVKALAQALVATEGADLVAHVLALGFLTLAGILREMRPGEIAQPSDYEQQLDAVLEDLDGPDRDASDLPPGPPPRAANLTPASDAEVSALQPIAEAVAEAQGGETIEELEAKSLRGEVS